MLQNVAASLLVSSSNEEEYSCIKSVEKLCNIGPWGEQRGRSNKCD